MMKAVVKSSPSPGIEIRDVAPPRPQPGEVLVRVEAVGICGSDVHIYEWTPGYEFLAKYFPRIIGHEFSGEIIELGQGAETSFRPGDRVTSETCKTCGQCFFCKQGKGILCVHRSAFGRMGFERDGAMAEYVVVPKECLHPIPPGVSLEEAALTEPAAVALGAVERADFFPGDPVAIFGPGPIGIMILQICKALGAGPITMIGLEADRKRLEVAQSLGADRVLIGQPEENLHQIMESTQKHGVGVVFEVSGSPAAASLGLRILRKFGEMILVGIYPAPISVDATHQMVRQMKTIKGSYGGASLDWDRVLNLVAARKLNLAPLISMALPLEKAAIGFEAVLSRDALKVIFKTNL
jgi:2-desacetyl-2-hydroxyethyl bacteriochlorophyllide A dehydrogenase